MYRFLGVVHARVCVGGGGGGGGDGGGDFTCASCTVCFWPLMKRDTLSISYSSYNNFGIVH